MCLKLFFFIQFLSFSVVLKASDKIGITQIIGHPAFDRNLKGIQDTLEKNGIKKEDIEFQSAQGSPTLAAEIARRFSRDRKIVITMGTASSQAFLPFQNKKELKVVFTSVTDPLGARLLKNLQAPEGNITGISNNVSALKQLQYMKKVLGRQNFKLGILYNPGDSNSLSALRETENAGKNEGILIVKAPANKLPDMLSATQKLIKEVDVIFVNNDNLALSALSSIVLIAEKAMKPVFSSDVDTLSLGVLGALGADQYELGCQTANMVLTLLGGKSVSSIPVAYPEKVIPSINRIQAKKLGIQIDEESLKNLKL